MAGGGRGFGGVSQGGGIRFATWHQARSQDLLATRAMPMLSSHADGEAKNCVKKLSFDHLGNPGSFVGNPSSARVCPCLATGLRGTSQNRHFGQFVMGAEVKQRENEYYKEKRDCKRPKWLSVNQDGT
jgi:hypothetical protein